MNTPEQHIDQDRLTPLRRGGELLNVTAMLFLLGFLVYHQGAGTGFFTARFGTLEMVCLYGPILLALIASTARALTGRLNPARPFDAATSLCLAMGSLWLLIRFPFDYTHLADALPTAIRFVLARVTDDVGKVLLALQVIIGPISAIQTARKYLSIRQREPESGLR